MSRIRAEQLLVQLRALDQPRLVLGGIDPLLLRWIGHDGAIGLRVAVDLRAEGAPQGQYERFCKFSNSRHFEVGVDLGQMLGV